MTPTITLHHISDLHVGRADPTDLDRRLAMLDSSMKSGDLVVATGDITESGTAKEFGIAEQLLGRFCGRIVLARGNHDIGHRGLAYNPETNERWRSLLYALRAPTGVLHHDCRVDILPLDTCLYTKSPLDFACGRLGWRQRWRLRRAMASASAAGRGLVVAMHHDPIRDRPLERLQDSDDFLRDAAGRVDAVLFGHTHDETTWTFRGSKCDTVFSSAPAFKGRGVRQVEVAVIDGRASFRRFQ